MSLDRVAVIPSSGIGDGLIMMVASHRLLCLGYHVDTFSKPLIELENWFVGHHFHKRPEINDIEQVFKNYDLIIVQNDNSEFAKKIISLYHEGKLRALSVFYPTYSEKKHHFLTPLDRVFDETKPMVDNTAQAISSLLGLTHLSKNNGIKPPVDLIHRHKRKRILIHPTSKELSKNWTDSKFLKLANSLLKMGFEPVLTMSSEEKKLWEPFVPSTIQIPTFPSLHDLACFVYESGLLIGNDSAIGHLCSNLQIPTLIISNHYKRMQLWRPGWYLGKILTPSKWIPNIKGYRLRETKWQSFISLRMVKRKFKKLYKAESF